MTWRGLPEPQVTLALGPRDWLRVLRRGIPVLLVLVWGLAILLLLRLVERPIAGQRRPLTGWIPQLVSRFTLWCMGFRRRLTGVPMRRGGAVVANHTSWLDIFALNAGQRVQFVAKAEVRGWAGIGWLARATGTLFIRRDRREAERQTQALRQSIAAGQLLALFPEGTSTDGCRVLPFRSTLFAAFEGGAAPDAAFRVQPASIAWHPPPGAQPGYYGWWGDMAFLPDLLKVLATPHQGLLELRYHPPQPAGADRKTLARGLEEAVRAGQPLAAGRCA